MLNKNVKRELKIPSAGTYNIHYTFGTINMGNGNGFAKVRFGYYLKSNPKAWKGCPSSERMVTEFRSAQDFGKVSMNAHISAICDIPGEATLGLQGWTNCGTERCGIWNSANGFEELTAHQISKVDTTRRPVRAGANTNVGGGGWKEMGPAWRWYPQDKGRYLVTLDARTYQANSGFLKCQLRLNGKVIDSSERMVTEYQGLPFQFANHNAGFAWIVDQPTHRAATIQLWVLATGTNIGLQTDSNGWNQMDLIKVRIYIPPVHTPEAFLCAQERARTDARARTHVRWTIRPMITRICICMQLFTPIASDKCFFLQPFISPFAFVTTFTNTFNSWTRTTLAKESNEDARRAAAA